MGFTSEFQSWVAGMGTWGYDAQVRDFQRGGTVATGDCVVGQDDVALQPVVVALEDLGPKDELHVAPSS